PFLPAWPVFSRGASYYWIGGLSFVFIFAAFFALWRLKWVPGIALLLLGGFSLGASRYFQTTDLTNPHHISHLAGDSYDKAVILRGTIIQDPDYRERYVNVTLQPEEVVLDPKKPEERIRLFGNTGLVRATIYPNVGNYYWRVSYGDRVELAMPLMKTRDLTNPSGFNFGRYLRARGVYATAPPWGIRQPGHIRYLGRGRVSFLVKLSLDLKLNLLSSIRRTMPYPESAFLGGVTLGLRAGLPQKIKLQFQETGVGHVLAVSGLHVGFVHALLLMICRVFRIHRRISYFVIVFGLIVFAIITGASPATQRAVLMSSIGQAIYTFGGLGIRGSTVMTIPLAGMILLLLNPTIAPDGSFVLSIVAVWSLAHLSGAMVRLLEIFGRGWKFLAGLFFMLVWTGIAVLDAAAFTRAPAWISLGLVSAAAVAAAFYLDRKYPMPGVSLFVLPGWFTGLAAAQGAILLGMTFPLSAMFFQRYSVSGTYANFIAIPLIGFIVQLGLLAGLLELIFTSVGLPAVGTYIALCINASNWYLCQLFLLVTAFFSKHFPYPYVPMPSVSQRVIFYVLVMGFVFWKPLTQWAQSLLEWARTPRRRWAVVGVFTLLIGSIAARTTAFSEMHGKMRVLFFDCGHGNSILIRTPHGKAILIDGGPSGRGGWNTGETVLAPVLAKFNVKNLETVVLTSPRESQGGGLPFVLDHFTVNKIFSTLDGRYFSPRMTFGQFLRALGDRYLINNRHDKESHEAFTMMHDLFVMDVFRAKMEKASAGDVLYEEEAGGKKLILRALWPLAAPLRNTKDDVGNNSMVLKLTYGEVSFLFVTQLRQEGEWALLDAAGDELKSDWLLVPANGNIEASSPEFLEKVAPKNAVMQTGYVGWRDRRRYHVATKQLDALVERYTRRGITLYRTDVSGAVTVTTDGEDSQSETVLPVLPTISAPLSPSDREARDKDLEIFL
ncbi:MAG TPA: ComEC/Rec2 family competence protein, partial [Elusimicrobiota bacterium]|nr:ComEC/Rec2 family competence protein [Elusimicrobiota bacterium]